MLNQIAPHKPNAKIYLFFIDKTSLYKNYSCPLEDSYNITKQLGYSLHGLWILDGVIYWLLARQFKPKHYAVACVSDAVLCMVHFHDFANNIKP